MRPLRVLGIMSGTSLDGVDLVMSTWNSRLEGRYGGHASVSFPSSLRRRLLRCAEGDLGVRDLSRLHHDLGRFYAGTASKIVRARNWKPDLIGLHGQTVFHEAPRSTLQIGEPSYLATALAKPVIADFRVADLSAGGQGAPLATFFHALLLRKYRASGPCAFHNLGGISNVSYFSKGRLDVPSLKKKPMEGKFFSFDTGPANMLIDALMARLGKSYDDNGRTAASGFVHHDLIRRWIKSDRYLKKRPPKSCGREEYGEKYFDALLRAMKSLNTADRAATLTEFTAATMALSYRKLLPVLPKVAVFAGGGTKNAHLMFRIRYHLPEVRILTSEDLGWPSQAVEGGAFAALAVAKQLGLYGHLPRTTGARRPVLLGKVVQTVI